MPYEYTANGKRISLMPDEDFIAVRFREPAPHSLRAAATNKPNIAPFSTRLEVPNEKFTIFNVARSDGPDRSHAAAMGAMIAEQSVARVAPVFRHGQSKVLATDRILLGFKPQTANRDQILQQHGCEVIEQRDGEYLVRLDETADPFEVVAKLNYLQEIEYAEPDFVTVSKHLPRFAPAQANNLNDPLMRFQYALSITRAIEAFALQQGDPRIKIAILDEGVDTRHEDLRNAIAGGFDATDNDEFQEPNTWDGHGTACAGLAAAIPNNRLGVRGTGGGCSILAVRIAFSDFPGGDWKTDDSTIRRAIDWSWERGRADVLSNSWGGGPESTAITNAFERARTQGRGGKGCVIVIAAGNDDGPVSFPGTLDNILTVSASNEFDEPKTRTSHDGETFWGSSFGPEVDVAAPGVHNYTTDISGEGGYNDDLSPGGNYFASFNGTSSATPLVAGVAAIVLSANPDLTEQQVREIIRATADKVGPVPYVSGRNDRMGHGRLNMLKAVQAARNGA